MKKTVAILFTFIFLFNLAGYYFVFLGMQHQTRKAMKIKIKQSIPDSQLTLIKINKNENDLLNWLKENKEFKYKENIYDVVRKNTDNNGNTYYYCINDKQEEKLFADLDTHIKNHIATNSPQNKGSKDIVKNIIKDYFSTNNSLNFHQFTIHNLQFTIYNPLYTPYQSKVSTPPPELV